MEMEMEMEEGGGEGGDREGGGGRGTIYSLYNDVMYTWVYIRVQCMQ